MFTVYIHDKSRMNHQLTGLAHPRARGIGTLDQTAFLQSQKHWNLERYDGWTGVEVLFEFDKVKFKNGAPNPSYEVPWLYEEDCIVLDLDNEPLKAFESIPLTISFAVEGALMEAIIRYDERISIRDFRRPGTCGKGPIIEKHALNERRNRFRLANCVSSWGPPRKGCPAIRSHLESLLTPEMKAANTTRGLRKLSKAEQDEAKKGNAGRHMQNAAGWAKKLRKDGQGGGIPAPKRVRTKEKRNQRRNPRAIRPRPVVTPQIPVEAVWDPNLDPQLMDLDGFGPLPGGGATSHASMQTESMMEDQGYGPLPVGGATGYANMRTESMLEDEEPNPFPDLIDWSGEGD
ncbi:hypothetical protein BDR22DRAFT_834859 [Usnea florida]